MQAPRPSPAPFASFVLRGLLELVPDAVDTRIKYIHPTPKLLAALGKFAEVLYP